MSTFKSHTPLPSLTGCGVNARAGDEPDDASAEVDRLTRGLCSLLLHDGERYGRVAVPNIVRLLLGEAQPWEVER